MNPFVERMVWVVAAVALLAWPAVAADEEKAVPEGHAEIQLDLPEPNFGATPSAYFGENLEESWKLPPPVYAPEGTENVAAGKPVTASAAPLVGKLEQVTDGDKSYEDKSLIELPEGVQWVQIDLGAPHRIYGIAVWHYHAAERVYFDVVARVASDAEFTKDVVTVYNNDHDNSSGLGLGSDREYVEKNRGRLMGGGGAVARYVRLYSNGNTAGDTNHYIEIEVYGVPAG